MRQNPSGVCRRGFVVWLKSGLRVTLSRNMTRTKAIKTLKAISYVGIYGGLLLPLMFIPVVIFPFVFSKLIYFQVIIGLTFPAYLVLAWMDPRYRPPKHLLYFAISGYFVALALSVLFAVDPARAWWGNQERMNGLFTLIHFLAWMTMTVGLLQTWEHWKKILNYEIALSGLMAVVAMIQRFKPDLLLFPAGPRVGGLLDNPIYMAAYQIFNLFFIGLLFLKEKNKKWRIFYGVIAALDIVAFVFAESRGALVGLAAGFLVFAVFIGLFSKERKIRKYVLTTIAALFVVYGVLFAFRHEPIVMKLPIGRLLDFSGSVETRLIAWNIAWEGFLERPLTGWGLDNFHLLFNEKYNPQSLRFGLYETWFDRAHNTVLDVLSMTGLVGFLAYAFIYIALFYSIWRAYKKGWIDVWFGAFLTALPVAYFVQNLFVFDHPAGFIMSYLLFALVISASRGRFVGEPEEITEEKKTHSAPWVAFGVLQVLMLLFVWRTSILPFKASELSIKANNTIVSNPARAFDYMKQAHDTWTPYLDEQSFLLARNLIGLLGQGRLQQMPNWEDMYAFAKQLSEEEIARHPRNTHPRFIYARLAHAISSIKPEEAKVAEEQYLDAIKTSPERQQLYDGLAQLYLQMGRVDDALALLQKSQGFDLESGHGYWTYGLVLFYNKKDYANGAEQIIKSQTVTYPYALSSSQELIPLFDAYMVHGDKDALSSLIDRLSSFPKASPQVYGQIAMQLQLIDQPDLSAHFLELANQIDPGTQQAFEQLAQDGAGAATGSAEIPKAN